jgi:ketosteroid isomerase-like protein
MAGEAEIVRKALAAFNAGDNDLVVAAFDPDVELVPARAVLEGSEYRGHEGFQRFVADMDEDWDTFHPELDEVRELGDGRVLVLGHLQARGKASGMEVDSAAAWLCDVREGRITRVRFYTDEQAALEAADIAP